MAEIKYSKELYDAHVLHLYFIGKYMDVDASWMMDEVASSSAAIDIFIEMYEQIRTIVRDYIWSLDNLAESLKNVGEAIYNTDQNIKNGM
ncbi:MAG: hypothetical protein J5962_03535 [Lachnospiraceae bacterium]|nr:hypothetical protein [Lachnospiraceae bacterium]